MAGTQLCVVRFVCECGPTNGSLPSDLLTNVTNLTECNQRLDTILLLLLSRHMAATVSAARIPLQRSGSHGRPMTIAADGSRLQQPRLRLPPQPQRELPQARTLAPARSSRGNAKPGEPVGMSRAKQWTPAVENAFRLQEAGYRGVEELLALGLPEPERWENGFIRKLQTRHSWDNNGYILLYFRQTPECEPRYLNRVKLFRFA